MRGIGDKRNAHKFTIQFNAADPHHSRAMDILNGQGRRKAQFIVTAVLHYVSCTKQPEDIIAGNIDYGVIESIVKKILAQHNNLPEKSGRNVPDYTSNKIEDCTLNDIMTSVDIFRNKGSKEDTNFKT